jgi:thioredoxin reductase (NADPH)
MYDLIIIGAGPAGLSASIYASRYKLNHIVVGEETGGQAVNAWSVENYPGFEKIAGKELMEKFKAQAEKLGAEILSDSANKIEKKDGGYVVHTASGKIYESASVILALGMKPRKLNLPNEDKFVGKGVAYCATCDAPFFRNKTVAVIGGGDAAGTAALHLSEFAEKIYIVYMKGGLLMEPSWQEKIKANPKIEMVECDKITGIEGENVVSGLTYEANGESKKIAVQGIFVEIGSTPGVVIAQNLGVSLDEQNYIIVDAAQATNVENIFAAGDVTTSSNKFRQIITAASEGAVAAGSVYKKLKLQK